MKLNFRRVAIGSVLAVSLLVAFGALRLTRPVFREAGYFEFYDELRPDLQLHRWLPDCDGDGFPDLATVFKDSSTLVDRLPKVLRLPSHKTRFSRLYSGRTGKVICQDELLPFNGQVVSIEGYDKRRNQIDLIRWRGPDEWLYHGGSAVREFKSRPSGDDELQSWLYQNEEAIDELLGLENSEHLDLDSMGVCYDPESRRKVFVIYAQCYAELSDSWVLLLDQADFSVVKSVQLEMAQYEALANRTSATRYLNFYQVDDLDGDGVLDFYFRDLGQSLKRSRSVIELNGKSGQLQNKGDYLRTPRRYIVLESGLNDLDRYFELKGKFRSSRKLSFFESGYSTSSEALLQSETDWTNPFGRQVRAREVADFNNDGVLEISISAMSSGEGVCVLLLDGASLTPYADLAVFD